MPSPLWTPSAERIAAANMTAHMRAVSQRWNVPLAQYEELYRFSIDRPDAFWTSMKAFQLF